MVGGKTLCHLDLMLQNIMENNRPFGGISILAVGDLLQLNPVGDRPVFKAPSSATLDALARSIWQRLFRLRELIDIVRQRGDTEFADILSRVRTGEQTKR